MAVRNIAVHPSTAGRAFYKAGQEITGLVFRGCSGMPGKAAMDNRKYFIRDDRLMGALYDRPFAFIRWNHLFASIGNAFELALNEVSNVYFVFQNGVDGCESPHIPFDTSAGMVAESLAPFLGFIDGRRHYLQGIELFYNPACGNSVRIPSENQSYNFSGLRIDNKSVPVLRAFYVAIRGVISQKFPTLPLHGKGTFDFQRELADIVVIHDIRE